MPKGKKKMNKVRHSPGTGSHNTKARTSFSSLQNIRNQRPMIYSKASHKIVYWSTLILLLVCNLTVSVVLIPYILVLSTAKFYLLIALLGFVFGFLFNILIQNLEHIELKHHLFAIVFIPVVAVINIFVMVGISNRIASIIGIFKYEDPFLPAMLYAIIFLLPYAFSMLRKAEKHPVHHHF